jgi:hypothetical protein
MRSPVAAAIAIGVGFIVLLGFFIPTGMDTPAANLLQMLRTILVDWSVTLAAFASLVAIIGLLAAHTRKLRARRTPDRYSFFVLAGFAGAFVFGVYAYTFNGDVPGYQMVVNALQVPVEASLMAVLTVTLTLALLRLFQRRSGLLPVVFAASVLVFLLMNSGVLASLDAVDPVVVLLAGLQALPVAGGRGILIGIALGSILAGLRILLGADRPYSG